MDEKHLAGLGFNICITEHCCYSSTSVAYPVYHFHHCGFPLPDLTLRNYCTEKKKNLNKTKQFKQCFQASICDPLINTVHIQTISHFYPPAVPQQQHKAEDDDEQ